MGKLRHLGIRTEDTGKLASFYVDVFDMKVIHKSKEEGGTIFLSDGYFNLAIIPNKDQNSPNGLYHFGFEVENGEAIVDKMKKINPNKLPKPRPNGQTLCGDPRVGSGRQLFRHFGAWLSRCPTGWREETRPINGDENLCS